VSGVRQKDRKSEISCRKDFDINELHPSFHFIRWKTKEDCNYHNRADSPHVCSLSRFLFTFYYSFIRSGTVVLSLFPVGGTLCIFKKFGRPKIGKSTLFYKLHQKVTFANYFWHTG